MSHTCHAKGCDKVVVPELLMCKKHWDLVPRDLKRDVWQHYRPGQCDDKNPTQAYLDAADAAIEAVEEAELEAERIKSEPRPRLGW